VSASASATASATHDAPAPLCADTTATQSEPKAPATAGLAGRGLVTGPAELCARSSPFTKSTSGEV
jgi:hypothetical protein